MEWRRDGFVISTDAGRLDLNFTVDNLAQTYRGKNTPKDKIRRSIDNALIFGLYREGGGQNSGKNWGQVRFCRVVSDKARFAWLSDVFVLDETRGLGLGKWLMECTVSHPDLMDVKRFFSDTADAHGLHRQYGFESLVEPKNFMLKTNA